MKSKVLPWMLVGLVLGGALLPGSVQAERKSTVIDGPGFHMEEKRGWFGTTRRTYKDAMGNTVVEKKGPLGRKSSDRNIMGSRTVMDGNNVTVYGPNGAPMVVKKKSWLGGSETRIDGNGIWNNMRELFKDTP